MKTLALLLVVSVAASAAAQKTFANPLDLDYRFMPEAPSRREAADPVMTLYRGDYFLFASKSGGYWHSPDMRTWKLVVPEGLPLEDYAPAVVTIDGRMYYTAHKSHAIFTSDYPKAGKWRKVAYLDEYADPAFFLDDDGKLYLYYGSSLNGGISVVQLDYRDNFKVVAGPVKLMGADYEHHGWERSGPDNLGATMSEGFRIAPYIEGSWMTKHDGVYYLQYAAPGTVWNSYADGVYTSTSPMGGFTYAPYSPFSYKPGGFVGSAGHGAMFQDKSGNYWRVTTLDISVLHKFERRIGLFPAGFDHDGVIRVNTYLGDYPQYLPGVASSPLENNRPPWTLLSAGKRVTASSSLDGHSPQMAVDEDIRTQWSAKTDDFGEWLKIDLGASAMIYAIQLNFGEQGTRVASRDSAGVQQYTLTISTDERHWQPIVDQSNTPQDGPHTYIELPTPVNARYVMITNAKSAAGGLFAIRDLRLFGDARASGPGNVDDFTVTRNASDDRSVTMTWKKASRATGYIIRYGTSPDKLYNNFQVGDVNTLTMNSLNSGVAYWFTIDAIGEGGVNRGRRSTRG